MRSNNIPDDVAALIAAAPAMPPKTPKTNKTSPVPSRPSSSTASSIISGVGLALVYALVACLSGMAIKPTAESYAKQRRFVTDASHEPKTPLSVINANTEVIEITDGESEWTKGIHEQVARMAQLTERLVFLAKMDEGGELDMEDCDLSELAKRAIAEAHHGKALCTTNGVDTITFGIVLRP